MRRRQVVVTPERPVSCSPHRRKTVTERGWPALRKDDPFARSDFHLPYSRTCDNRKLLDTPDGNNNVTGFPASAGAAMMRLARDVPSRMSYMRNTAPLIKFV
jgi:hypothetical protein